MYLGTGWGYIRRLKSLKKESRRVGRFEEKKLRKIRKPGS
jgi:hypothetical protein